MKTRLQTQYKDIAERIISMALESVDYSEDKACRILDIVIQEDKETKMKTSETTKKKDTVEKNVSFKEVRYLFEFLVCSSHRMLFRKTFLSSVLKYKCVWHSWLILIPQIWYLNKYNTALRTQNIKEKKTSNQILHAPKIYWTEL